jgi:hypothetical protein
MIAKTKLAALVTFSIPLLIQAVPAAAVTPACQLFGQLAYDIVVARDTGTPERDEAAKMRARVPAENRRARAQAMEIVHTLYADLNARHLSPDGARHVYETVCEDYE